MRLVGLLCLLAQSHAIYIDLDDYTNGSSTFSLYSEQQQEHSLTCSTGHKRHVHIAGRIYDTDMSLAYNSSLWFWFHGFHLNGKRLKLLPRAPRAGTANVACNHDYIQHTCRFPAQVGHNQTVNVTLFAPLDVTVVPYHMYSRIITQRHLELRWNETSIRIEEPFTFHERNDILVSNRIRHSYSFLFNMHTHTGTVARNRGAALTSTTQFLFTLFSIVALCQMVYQLVERSPAGRRIFLFLPIAALFYFHPVRICWLVVLLVGGVVQPSFDFEIGVYCVLEALWSTTMLLNEEEDNFTSVTIASLMYIAVCCNIAQHPRCWPRYVLLLYSLWFSGVVNVNAYLEHQLFAFIGIHAPLLSCCLIMWFTSLSFHWCSFSL